MILRLPFARLYAFLLHAQWPVHIVQFEVKTASVAYWLAIVVSSPKRRITRSTVRALHPCPSDTGRRDRLFRFGTSDRWPVGAVQFEDTAGTAEVVSCTVSSPQRRHTGGTIQAILRLAGYDGTIEGFLGTRKGDGLPRTGWTVPTGRGYAVSTPRVELHVGSVTDNRRHARITLDVFERRRGRGCTASGPVRIVVGFNVLIGGSRAGAIESHLRARGAWLLVMKGDRTGRPQGGG